MQPSIEVMQHLLNLRNGDTCGVVWYGGRKLLEFQAQRRDLLAQVIVQVSRDPQPLIILRRNQAARQGGPFATDLLPFAFELRVLGHVDERDEAFE
jgi:hypothetical protein